MNKITYKTIFDVDEIFKKIDLEIKDNFKKIPREYMSDLYGIRRYLFHAKRSPLPLSNTFDSFKRWNNFSKTPENIYSFISYIEELDLIQEHLYNLPMLIREASIKFTKIMPVYDGIENEYILNPKKNVIIISHEFDRVKLKNIISDDSNFDKNISVLTWKRLSRHISDYDKEKTVIISVEPPHSGDNIYSNRVSSIRFILNNESVEVVKDLISKMKIGHSHYPIYFSSNVGLSPLLLNELELSQDVEKTQVFKEEISTDIMDDFNSWCKKEIIKPSDAQIHHSIEQSDKIKIKENPNISKDDEAIIAYEKHGNSCMIFPLHSSIYVIGKGDKPIPVNELVGDYGNSPLGISVSKKGISIKVHLADWLVNDIDMGKRTRDNFEWDSFYDLLKDSTLWIDYLRNEAEIYFDDRKLAEKISESLTTANDIEYILNWWRSNEGIITTADGENIIIPMIEHPKARDDLDYIADIIDDNTLKKSSERVWQAAIEVQNLRNKFIHGFQKIEIENENIKRKTGRISGDKLIEILQEADVPDFFINLFKNFEVLYVKEIKKEKMKKNLPAFKKINITDLEE